MQIQLAEIQKSLEQNQIAFNNITTQAQDFNNRISKLEADDLTKTNAKRN